VSVSPLSLVELLFVEAKRLLFRKKGLEEPEAVFGAELKVTGADAC
jgi:hypothetical protein